MYEVWGDGYNTLSMAYVGFGSNRSFSGAFVTRFRVGTPCRIQILIMCRLAYV